VAEDIIITPASGKFDFYDTASTVTTMVIESGSIKFKRGATTYLAFNSAQPTIAITNADLRLGTS
jgi:hypothetical protein